ncbi:MAG TPA: type II secretion system protein [Thermoanaerobaculia bacterium]|nr:type II secretion system protein [Thermoanaerobaculia bacterium]
MPPRRAEQGYTLAVLAVMIAVLSILLSMALPYWSTQVKREKEEELIFRGLQYAEAIRVFRNKNGRLPVRLEELIKSEPRVIRQLWKDPMTEDGSWALIFEGGPEQPGQGGDATDPSGRPVRQQPNLQGQGLSDLQEVPIDPGGGSGLDGPTVTIGPIAGVRSKSKEESLQLFFDRSRYDEWQFTYQMLTTQQPFGVQGADPATFSIVKRGDQIGRPLRPGLVPPGGVPGQQQGSGLQPGGLPGATPGSKPPGGAPKGPPPAQPELPTQEEE